MNQKKPLTPYQQFQRLPISTGAKMVFKQMEMYARNKRRVCFAKYETLAEDICVCKKSVVRAVAELKSFGLIAVVEGTTRRNLEFHVADLEKWNQTRRDQGQIVPNHQGPKVPNQAAIRDKKSTRSGTKSPRPMNHPLESHKEVVSKVAVPPRVTSPKGDARRTTENPSTPSTASAAAGSMPAPMKPEKTADPDGGPWVRQARALAESVCAVMRPGAPRPTELDALKLLTFLGIQHQPIEECMRRIGEGRERFRQMDAVQIIAEVRGWYEPPREAKRRATASEIRAAARRSVG